MKLRIVYFLYTFLAFVGCQVPTQTVAVRVIEADAAQAGGDSASNSDTNAGDAGDSFLPGDLDVNIPTAGCGPLPASPGNVVVVGPTDPVPLKTRVAQAPAGTVILLQDGVYDLSGGNDVADLVFTNPWVTLRSQNNNRDAVILDGGYVTSDLITILASNVTIAHLTIRRSARWLAKVQSQGAAHTLNTRFYDVAFVDADQSFLVLQPVAALNGFWVDDGVVACSLFSITAAGRAHQPCQGKRAISAFGARGWQVYDNRFENLYQAPGCANYVIAMTFDGSSSEATIERNTLVNCADGIQLGFYQCNVAAAGCDAVTPTARFPTAACSPGYVDFQNGVVRNNFIYGDDSVLPDFDAGILVWNGCGVEIVHNTVITATSYIPFSNIEWRYDTSRVHIANNLMTHQLRDRTTIGGTGQLEGNVENAPLTLFLSSTDVHLDPLATGAIDQGVSLAPGLCDFDIDGDSRTAPTDVGADQVP